MSNESAQQVANPFGHKDIAPANHNALANAEAEKAIQEVQAAMTIAKKFPRDQRQAMDNIINACCRESLAEAAIYSYPRGGQEVTGPSIRLAEALAQEWGNIQFGIRELSNDGNSSTVEAFAWDIERNTKQTKVFQVGHSRFAKGQLKKLTDPRDIYEMIANQGARRLRACILGVIPGDVTEAALRQCEVTQASSVEVNPEAIKKMVDAFSGYGVTAELIEKRIGRRVESINGPVMLNLRRIYQSLKDGMSKPADWFDLDDGTVAAEPKVSDINDQLKGKSETKKQTGSTDEAPPKKDKTPDYWAICDLIEKAETDEALDKLDNLSAWENLAEGEAPKLRAMIDARRNHLEQ